jgi:hypothetical protein
VPAPPTIASVASILNQNGGNSNAATPAVSNIPLPPPPPSPVASSISHASEKQIRGPPPFFKNYFVGVTV